MSFTSEPRKLFKTLGIGPGVLLVPVSLSFVSAIFEGIGAGLLIPVLKGLIEGSFSFLETNFVGRILLAAVPDAWRSDHLKTFIVLLSLVFFAGFSRIVIGYLADVSYISRLRAIGHQLRTLLFSRTLGYGKLFFDRQKQGELHNVILSFSIFIMAELQGLHGQIKSIFMLAAYLVLMIGISWELTLVMFALFPVYHFSISYLLGKIGEDSDAYASADSEVSAIFYNVMSAIGLVKSSRQEQKEAENFENKSGEAIKILNRMDRRSMLLFPVQESITLLIAVFVVCCIAYIVSSNPARDVSSFLVYIYLLKRSASSFSSLGNVRGTLAELNGYFIKVNQLFDKSDKHIIPSGQKEFAGISSEIEFKNLSFRYSADIKVLNDVSFSVAAGEVTAIVGPSGSGKSTLIHLLLRFYDCPAASIYADGIDIRELSITSLRAKMALVSQESQLFHDTLRNNIVYGVQGDISDTQIHEVLVKARLDEYVNSLPNGLDTLVGDRGVQLSGGEKQRVSIARAMLREPEILILDEATSALDATTERLVQSAIDELIHDRTVIVIAHRFSTLQNADKIVTIDKGEIVESGSLPQLLDAGGKFSRLWKDQELFH